MRLALAQINPTVGDLEGNARRIGEFADRARAAKADMVVFPELCLTGYPPKDLLLQGGFMEEVVRIAGGVGKGASAGLTLVFGAPLPVDPAHLSPLALHNSLLAYRDGAYIACYDKRLLPTYDVFDEDRYFRPGAAGTVVEAAGTRVGLSICEDLWHGHDAGFAQRYIDAPNPMDDLCRGGAQLVVNPSASPFVLGKSARQREILRAHASQRSVYVAAVNQVGGNDDLIFDGRAQVYGPDGSLVAQGLAFEEDLVVVDLPGPANSATGASTGPGSGAASGPDPDMHDLFRALVLGVRDYCRKTGFRSAVLGLSGGIDSAVTAVLACAALGSANVLGASMPSRYSSEGSKTDAALLAAALGMRMPTIPIEPPFEALQGVLAEQFAGTEPGITEENLQSRVRGTVLMALSNKFGHLLLTTGNKSELAVGYCTLYGDMNGGLAVLSDVTKELVYALARWMNTHWRLLKISGLTGPPIPEASITKPPSAELRPNQTDQDSLPPYPVLDEIIERYVERRQSAAAIQREMAADAATVRRVVRLIDLSEYKRKQAPVGLKVTGVAFGSGRRMPIAQGWKGVSGA